MLKIEECIRDLKNPIVLFAILIIVGEMIYFQAELYRSFDTNQYLSLCLEKESLFIGKIYSSPKENKFNSAYFLQVQYIVDEGIKKKSNATLYVKGSKYISFERGDIVQVRGKLTKPKGSILPELFSEKKYLHNKGIQYVLQEKSGSQYLSRSCFSRTYRFIDLIRNNLLIPMPEDLKVRLGAGGNNAEVNLINAILFGSRASPLNDELKLKVRELGLSHIVSASGFNVGILASVIFFAFKLFTHNRFIPSLASFLFILFYSALADFSPSITRAIIFATLVLSANLMRKKIKPLPAISFIVLLFFFQNPYNLLDLGFQLSLFAFAGLILFYKDIYNLLMEFTSSYLKSVCTILVSSFIAQIYVFPLICFYFHNIQIMGIISNLLAAPLAAFILTLGIAFTIFNQVVFLKLLALFIYGPLILVAKIFLWWVNLLYQIPVKQLYFPYISFTDLIFIYGFILFIFYVLLKKKIKVLLALTLFLILFLAFPRRESDLKIYFIKKYNKDYVLFQSKDQNILFYTRSFTDRNLIDQYLKNTHNENKLVLQKLSKNILIKNKNCSVELIANYDKPINSIADFVKLPILMKSDPDFRDCLNKITGKIIVNDYKRLSDSSMSSKEWIKNAYKDSFFLSETGTLELKDMRSGKLSYL